MVNTTGNLDFVDGNGKLHKNQSTPSVMVTAETDLAGRLGSYPSGRLLVMGNTLYKVTANIANNGTFGNIVYEFANEAEALKDYFRECGKAVDSTHLTDSVSLLTKEGFELRHETF